MDVVIDPNSQLFMVRDNSSKTFIPHTFLSLWTRKKDNWRSLPKLTIFDLHEPYILKKKNKQKKHLNVPSNFPRVVMFIFIWHWYCYIYGWRTTLNFLERLVEIVCFNSRAVCSEMLKGQRLIRSAHSIFMHLLMVEMLILCTYSRRLSGLFISFSPFFRMTYGRIIREISVCKIWVLYTHIYCASQCQQRRFLRTTLIYFL